MAKETIYDVGILHIKEFAIKFIHQNVSYSHDDSQRNISVRLDCWRVFLGLNRIREAINISPHPSILNIHGNILNLAHGVKILIPQYGLENFPFLIINHQIASHRPGIIM